MALIHYLYAGHFIPEAGFIRYQGHEPVVSRPLNLQRVEELLLLHFGVASPDELADRLGLWITPRWIVCDLHGPLESIRFAAAYAEQEGAVLFDQGAFLLWTRAEIREAADLNVK